MRLKQLAPCAKEEAAMVGRHSYGDVSQSIDLKTISLENSSGHGSRCVKQAILEQASRLSCSKPDSFLAIESDQRFPLNLH